MDVDAELIDIRRRLLKLEGKGDQPLSQDGNIPARGAAPSTKRDERGRKSKRDDDRGREEASEAGHDLHGFSQAVDERFTKVEGRFNSAEQALATEGPIMSALKELSAKVDAMQAKVDEAARNGDAARHFAEQWGPRIEGVERGLRTGVHKDEPATTLEDHAAKEGPSATAATPGRAGAAASTASTGSQGGQDGPQ